MARGIGKTGKNQLEKCDDSELLTAWQDGEPGAAEVLLERHRERIERLFRAKLRAGGRNDDVDELCQRTLAALIGSFNRLEDPQAFRAFLRTIAHRTFADWLREKYKYSAHFDAGAEPEDASRRADTFDEEALDLRSVLRSLPARDLELLSRYYLELNSSAELANKLGRSPTGLRVEVSRIKSRMRDQPGLTKPGPRRPRLPSSRRTWRPRAHEPNRAHRSKTRLALDETHESSSDPDD